MMENLTKENFWNEMQEKYPKAMKNFCDWVDKYKEENNWNTLFNANWSKGVVRSNEGYLEGGEKTKAPKYHELPLAIQFGIFCEFLYEWCIEQGRPVMSSNIFIGKDLRREAIESINETFEIIEGELNE